MKILNNLPLLSYSKTAKYSCDESYVVSSTTVRNVLNGLILSLNIECLKNLKMFLYK